MKHSRKFQAEHETRNLHNEQLRRINLGTLNCTEILVTHLLRVTERGCHFIPGCASLQSQALQHITMKGKDTCRSMSLVPTREGGGLITSIRHFLSRGGRHVGTKKEKKKSNKRKQPFPVPPPNCQPHQQQRLSAKQPHTWF